jgi:hypothetical protein
MGLVPSKRRNGIHPVPSYLGRHFRAAFSFNLTNLIWINVFPGSGCRCTIEAVFQWEGAVSSLQTQKAAIERPFPFWPSAVLRSPVVKRELRLIGAADLYSS